MNKEITVYVAGHEGMVGSAIVRELKRRGYNNILYNTHAELDLENSEEVNKFFKLFKPKWVFLCAAKVGGIYANDTYPVDFLLNNMRIQNNVIECSHKYGVQKLMFFGSSCIFPKNCKQPIKEEYLLSSELEKTNESYAIAKISGIKLCSAYNKQYGTNFMSVMPCNLYGPNDNYHSENAHVLPMLIRRFHEAKIKAEQDNIKHPLAEIWGTGTARREFLYSDDLADACLFLMENYNASDIGELINIGYGSDYTITELAQKILKTIGFKAKISYDLTKPDGTPKKLMNNIKMKALGWTPKTNLETGLKLAYEDFLKNPNTKM